MGKTEQRKLSHGVEVLGGRQEPVLVVSCQRSLLAKLANNAA
jgi:hypothetical protein